MDFKKLILISVQNGNLVNAKWLFGKDKELIQSKDKTGNNLMWTALVNHQLEIVNWLDEKDRQLFDQALVGKDLSLLKLDNDQAISNWFTDRRLD